MAGGKFRPLHLGVGVSDGAIADELIAVAEKAISAIGHGAVVVAIATLDSRAGHPAVKALSAHLGLPVTTFPVDILEAETPRLFNPSETVFRLTGCHGVAEAAALASAGPAGKLVVGKTKRGYATVAIAAT